MKYEGGCRVAAGRAFRPVDLGKINSFTLYAGRVQGMDRPSVDSANAARHWGSVSVFRNATKAA